MLGHGSGGRLTAELVSTVFLPALSNPLLDRLNDSAEMKVGASRIAFTTDSFVVNPLRFPGGDIGALAVNGTVNDLAVAGSQPIALSAAFILEEGFPIVELEAIVESMRAAADRAGVAVIAADTKVVEHGKADGLFITTRRHRCGRRQYRARPRANPGWRRSFSERSDRRSWNCRDVGARGA